LDIWQVDLAIMKETKLTERLGLEFGVQAFNVFNHVQFGDFGKLNLTYLPGGDGSAGANLSAPGSFGFINSTVNGQGTNTGTGLPRQLQLMLRLKF
jgi:hypothetical protein